MGEAVLVINDLKGNGAERVVINLATELNLVGVKCLIVCFVRKIELPVPDGIEVVFFPANKYRWIPRCIRGLVLAPFLDKFICRVLGGNPGLVLSNLMPADRILAYSRLPNVHFVIHNTTSIEVATYFMDQNANKELSARLKLYRKKPCVGVSFGVTEDLQSLLPDHDEILTIHNPLSLDLLFGQSNESLEDPNLNEEYLIHVGKFNNAKRHDVLLRAYAISGIETPLLLLGVGPNYDRTRELANDLGIGERVHFKGFKKNPYPYIKQAKFMVMSSDFEGLGMVILEALALGTPVVSTDCPSGPSEILPAKNLVPVGDLQMLANLINQCDADPSQFIVHLAEQFTPEFAVSKYMSLLA